MKFYIRVDVIKETPDVKYNQKFDTDLGRLEFYPGSHGIESKWVLLVYTGEHWVSREVKPKYWYKGNEHE